MSGGSFNYLYQAVDLVEIGEGSYGQSNRHDLKDMAEFLAGLGWADAAAGETREWLELAEREIPKRLRDVWHAMEWWRSCDYGEGQALAEVQRYDAEATPARLALLDRAAEAAWRTAYPATEYTWETLAETTRERWRTVAKAARDVE